MPRDSGGAIEVDSQYGELHTSVQVYITSVQIRDPGQGATFRFFVQATMPRLSLSETVGESLKPVDTQQVMPIPQTRPLR